MSDLVSGCTISGEHGRVRRARVRSSLGSPLCVLPYSLDRYIYIYIMHFDIYSFREYFRKQFKKINKLHYEKKDPH